MNFYFMNNVIIFLLKIRVLCLALQENIKPFSTVMYRFIVHPTMHEHSSIFVSLSTFGVDNLLHFSLSNGCDAFF